MSHFKRLFAAVLLALPGCSKAPERIAERLAILPFENLTGDAKYDWIGPASQTMVSSQLVSAPKAFAFAAGSRQEAARRRATRNVAAYLTSAGGKLALAISVEDAQKVTLISSFTASAPIAAGLLTLLDAASHGIDPAARPYSTASETALRKLAEGDPASAIQADPAFAQALVANAIESRNRGDRDGALTAIRSARALGSKLPPFESAQLNVVEQSIAGSPQSRADALAGLARFTPNDPDVHKQLAEIAAQARDFKAAASRYQAAAALEPDALEFRNWLGYAQAMAGDLPAGVASMSEYAKRSPGDPNPLDSLGEIYFYSGKFAEAENAFLGAHAKYAGFVNGLTLFKAAQSRLLLGDVKAADDLFAKYADLSIQANDPAMPVRQAIWDWMAGRRKAAFERLEKMAREGQPPIAAAARSQLAVMYLAAGRRDDARKLAGSMTPVSQFLVQPSAAADVWRQRVAAVTGPDQLKSELLAYSLLLDGHPAEALPLLDARLRQANPFATDSAEELLAWALVSAGKYKEAEPFVSHWPLPAAQTDSSLLCLTFPRMVETRAKALQQAGKQAEAAKLMELYKRLSAD